MRHHILALLLIVGSIVPSPVVSCQGSTHRASVGVGGAQANERSSWPSISANGRHVAFFSQASNLVANDTNGHVSDVFVFDRSTGLTTMVSVSSAGKQGNQASGAQAISADGRVVAFASAASNLVPGDTNGYCDVFVHDRRTGQTTRVSVDSNGGQANRESSMPAISADGRFVAFYTMSTNLAPGTPMGGVFVHDRQAGVTVCVSVTSQGSPTQHGAMFPVMSADGRHVAFVGWGPDLVPNDTNGVSDIFVHDRKTRITQRASLTYQGGEANNSSNTPTISRNGRFVAFKSDANNLVAGSDPKPNADVFVRDMVNNTTTRVSVSSLGVQGNGHHFFPTISADGQEVAFWSDSSNLVPGDNNWSYDLFVHDLRLRATTRYSVDSAGREPLVAYSPEWFPALSADGLIIAYSSLASDLVPHDTNGVSDIFVHERTPNLRAIGQPRVGATVALSLFSPRDPSAVYVMGASLHYRPGIRLGYRHVPLVPDILLNLSLRTPSIFERFSGFLDGFGQGTAAIHIPNVRALIGIKFYTAFVTTGGNAPFGVCGVSNALPLTVTP